MKQYLIEQLTAEELYDLINRKVEKAKEEGYKLGWEEAQKTDWIREDEAMEILGCRRSKIVKLRNKGQIKYRKVGRNNQYSRKSCIEFDDSIHAENTQENKRPFKLGP